MTSSQQKNDSIRNLVNGVDALKLYDWPFNTPVDEDTRESLRLISKAGIDIAIKTRKFSAIPDSALYYFSNRIRYYNDEIDNVETIFKLRGDKYDDDNIHPIEVIYRKLMESNSAEFARRCVVDLEMLTEPDNFVQDLLENADVLTRDTSLHLKSYRELHHSSMTGAEIRAYLRILTDREIMKIHELFDGLNERTEILTVSGPNEEPIPYPILDIKGPEDFHHKYPGASTRAINRQTTLGNSIDDPNILYIAYGTFDSYRVYEIDELIMAFRSQEMKRPEDSSKVFTHDSRDKLDNLLYNLKQGYYDPTLPKAETLDEFCERGNWVEKGLMPANSISKILRLEALLLF